MRAWSDFFPDLAQDVLGCPEPTMEQYLRRAAQEFCARTFCWREDLPAITTTGVASYALRFPANAMLAKAIGASLNGLDVALEAADGTSLADRRDGSRGSARVLVRDAFNVTIMPTPAADLELILEAALKPSEVSIGLPDVVADMHRLAIATGAAARLLKINRAEWANPALAKDKSDEFEDAIFKSKWSAFKANSRNAPRTRGSYY